MLGKVAEGEELQHALLQELLCSQPKRVRMEVESLGRHGLLEKCILLQVFWDQATVRSVLRNDITRNCLALIQLEAVVVNLSRDINQFPRAEIIQ